jgi:hypothetical protein
MDNRLELISSFLQWIGAVSVPLFAYLGIRYQYRKKPDKAKLDCENLEKENEFLKENLFSTKLVALKELFDITLFRKLETSYKELFEKTKIDRFTVMFMMNGKVNFNYMSVLYDIHKSNPNVGDVPLYIKLKIDDQYRKMISNLTPTEAYWSDSASNIGKMSDYLELEKINSIGWFKVKRIALDDYNDLLAYLSLSSEDKEPLTRIERRRIELFVFSTLLPLLREIIEVPSEKDANELLEKIKTE